METRTHARLLRAPIAAALVLLLTALGSSAPANAVSNASTTSTTSSATAAAAGHCTDVAYTLAATPGGTPDQTIAGTLCLPAQNPGTTRVDVLVHGASYNRSYWDWPTQSGTYSYVAETLQAGRATFAYDRLGAGQSSHPLSALVTTSADAFILHEIISTMRASGFTGVDVVGHSFGSVIAIDEAACFHDIDELVVTGLLHSQGPGLATVTASFYPADLDPQFLLKSLDVGYLTSLPGTRATSFYSSAVDPAVVAYDEQHKDMISATELAAGVAESQLLPAVNASRLVTAPVLIVDGQQDHIFCGLYIDCAHPASVLTFESTYFPAAARLAVALIPATGHDIALHPSAPSSFADIDQWLRSS